MATKKVIKPIGTIDPKTVVLYTQSGSYIKNQRIDHPNFGLGTVIWVRYGIVVIRFDGEARERRFRSAKLTLKQRVEANGGATKRTSSATGIQLRRVVRAPYTNWRAAYCMPQKRVHLLVGVGMNPRVEQPSRIQKVTTPVTGFPGLPAWKTPIPY